MNAMPFHAGIFAAAVTFGSLSTASSPATNMVTYTCRPSDAGALQLRGYARLLASTSDSQYVLARNSLSIPATSDTNTIVVVTGPSNTCNKAGAALVTALGLNPAVSRSVYVIQIGTVYIVKDPTVYIGKFYPWVVIKSSNFKWVSTSMS